MRFLCLHGYATGVEVQHLPRNWEYEYLEAGMKPSKMVLPNLDQVPSPNYCWYNYPSSEEGFSQGASIATLLLLEYQKAHPGSSSPFKMVIYNSTFLPYYLDSGSITWDVNEKEQLYGTYEPGAFDASFGRKDTDWKQNQRTGWDYLVLKRMQTELSFPVRLLLKYMPQDVPEKLNVPSVHVRGVKDHYFFVDDAVSELFDPTTAKKMTHRGGHHFPRFQDELIRFAELIIETAASC